MTMSHSTKRIFFIFIAVIASFVGYIVIKKDSNVTLSTESIIDEVKVNEVRKIVKNDSRYNDRFAFFINMKIPSGKNRFFIYDLKANKIIDKGLVAHGSGSETKIKGQLKFSNVPNSLSTSLGKYAVGEQYTGKFGKAYKLYGLDATNSNAFDRNIVFHYYFDVPYKEQKGYICNSYGCPMVNKKYFEKVAKIIDNSRSQVLMYIYY